MLTGGCMRPGSVVHDDPFVRRHMAESGLLGVRHGDMWPSPGASYGDTRDDAIWAWTPGMIEELMDFRAGDLRGCTPDKNGPGNGCHIFGGEPLAPRGVGAREALRAKFGGYVVRRVPTSTSVSWLSMLDTIPRLAG